MFSTASTDAVNRYERFCFLLKLIMKSKYLIMHRSLYFYQMHLR
jgi:hypothetical protein